MQLDGMRVGFASRVLRSPCHFALNKVSHSFANRGCHGRSPRCLQRWARRRASSYQSRSAISKPVRLVKICMPALCRCSGRRRQEQPRSSAGLRQQLCGSWPCFTLPNPRPYCRARSSAPCSCRDRWRPRSGVARKADHFGDELGRRGRHDRAGGPLRRRRRLRDPSPL